MSEERARPSSPDPDEIEVTTDEEAPPSSVDPKAARRARRAKAKLALRIPDDEIARPQPASIGASAPEPVRATTNGEAAAAVAAPEPEPAKEAPPIQPARIISVGPPPPDPAETKTERRIPSAPPTAPLEAADEIADGRATQLDLEDDEAKTPIAPGVRERAPSDADIPVDEEEPIEGATRPRVPTIPSVPPPPPDAETKPRAAATSEDALEIDDVEAAAVLSSRPPPPRVSVSSPAIPAAPAVPRISSKPPVPPPAAVAPVAPITPPITPPIPADALSSTPQLVEDRERAKPRAPATALVDEEEARGIEEIEPDRASAPPSVDEAKPRIREDSGDEIDTSDVLVVAPAATAARPISTPPKAPAAAKAPPPLVKIPIVAPAPHAAPSQSPLAPPPLTEGLVPRRRARPWWEELFNDDFIRTMPKFTDAQVAAEVDFIEDSLGVAKGGALLDLGCGTGKQAVELSRRGYKVVGFDLSIAMLARAGEEAQEHDQKINFVQGDMREMTFEDAFDGVYCWGSTFGYFEEEKNAHVIQRVHKSLRQGGQFLLDVVSRDFVIAQSPSLAWFEGEGCVCMDEMTVDWITSRMRIKRTMMLDDGRSKEIEYSIRIYSLHELGKILHDGGFRVAEVSGRIQTPGVFFGPESPRTLILAEKR